MSDATANPITESFFRSWVGQTMFCPICGSILDYRRAVLVQNRVICAKDYDAIRARIVAAKGEDYIATIEQQDSAKLDFIDGRQYAAQRRKR